MRIKSFMTRSTACANSASLLALACGLIGAAGSAIAQRTPEAVSVRVVRMEQIGGGVERPTGGAVTRVLQPLPEKFYEVKDGIYRSTLNRISLRVPRIGEEKLVDVREAVALVRADGSPATTHLMFDPDGTNVAVDPLRAVSAVVVTRLRDDRPKDAESIIAYLDGGHVQRATMAGQGITYAQADTHMGPALRRIVRNRAHTVRFPYDLQQLKESATVTYGVTTFVVVGTDSMVEFSQLFPCTSRADAPCRAAAIAASEAFFDGVTSFRRYPPPVDMPASAAR
jgi:hypothetical protein